MGNQLRVCASDKSFNNDQGLPITILNASDDVRALVLEMGMRGFGEISRLCAIARPHIGVVTAVAEAHTERVGGIEGVARAKAELVQALDASELQFLMRTMRGCLQCARAPRLRFSRMALVPLLIYECSRVI